MTDIPIASRERNLLFETYVLPATASQLRDSTLIIIPRLSRGVVVDESDSVSETSSPAIKFVG